MTAVVVACVVCGSALAALVLILRHLERAALRAASSVTQSTEAELRELVRAVADRTSRLEMARSIR